MRPQGFFTTLGRLLDEDGVTHLEGCAPGSVDLVFADPPYNAGREAWDSFASDQAYLDWTGRWLEAASRALGDGGSAYVCGFSEVLADVRGLARRHFHGCRWLVWHYRNKANLGRDWGRSHESVLHLRKAGFRLNVDAARVPYNAHTLRYPTHPQAESSRYGGAGYVWQPHPLGAKPRDVIEVPTLTNGMREKTAHPTQKPLELVRRLVTAATAEGALVVDPFAGSGTTAVACELTGRRWVACELDGKYRKLARQRLTAARTPDGVATVADAEARRRSQRAKLR